MPPCSTGVMVTILKFLIIFQQGHLCPCFTLSPANYVVGLLKTSEFEGGKDKETKIRVESYFSISFFYLQGSWV